MLSTATVQELHQILKEEYGREITLSQATEAATALVGYFDLLASIDRKPKEYDNETRTRAIHPFS